MPRIVYIQADAAGQAYSPNGAMASRGFAFLGYDVKYFLPEELPDLALSPEVVVVGGMGTTRTALEQVAGRLPSLSGVPAVLSPYLGRECWRTTPGEVRLAERFPVFVKPYEDAKSLVQVIMPGMRLLFLPPGLFVSRWARFRAYRQATAPTSAFQMTDGLCWSKSMMVIPLEAAG